LLQKLIKVWHESINAVSCEVSAGVTSFSLFLHAEKKAENISNDTHAKKTFFKKFFFIII
jgi:hypothetical protein